LDKIEENLELEKELLLIGTKGVVQLFNAIRKKQRTPEEEKNYEKKEKLSKEKFMELLNKSDSKISEVDKLIKKKKIK